MSKEQDIPKVIDLEKIKKEVKKLKTGEKYYYMKSAGDGLTLYYEKLKEEEYNKALKTSVGYTPQFKYKRGKLGHSSTKWGVICPNCDGKLLIYCYKNSSDGHAAVEYDDFICENKDCRVVRSTYYTGYNYHWKGYD